MPVRNEAAFLTKSLGSVLSQDYPPSRMEILVADGMSTDGTRVEIGRLAAMSQVSVIVLDNPGRIAPTGLNVGLGRARGEVIVRVDGHTILEGDYVRQCVLALQRTGADNVGGRMKAVSETPFGRAVALATSSPFGVGGAKFHYSDREEWVDTVYMGCWPRSVFNRVGVFDEEMVRNQDDEFNYRLRENGGRVLLSPGIRSRYYNRATPRALWRQYFQYGFWKVRVLQKHPAQMQLRQFIPPAFVVGLSTVAAAALFSLTSRLLLAGVVAIYALAAGLAALVAVGNSEWRLAGRVGLAFAMLHLAYGSGFLWGLIHFRSRWRDERPF
ncbi:MAG TPA: glycosyltransferase family 2 protein [Thermoanaerobaculia bacterium]|nr:glycosyltransferase family 2 protein [Thermoanaerobaculia bacterium]